MSEHWQPHGYQERVVSAVIERDRLGLFLDPGLGKTAISLESYRRLWEVCDVSRLLVVAPLRPAYSVWPAEATKWAQFRGMRVHVLHGKGKTAEALGRDVADVYVINPEGLSWLEEQRWEWPEMLVIDESTKFKRTSAGRSRALARIMRGRFPRRYILTGTPSPNGYEDLHGQIRILDDGRALGASLKQFRESFCAPVQRKHGVDWEVRTALKPAIQRLIEPMVIRLDARDYLELPEKLIVDVPVLLPDEARGLYDRLRKELVLHLEDEGGVVAAVNAGVLTAKCRQVANGSVYLTDGGEPSAEAGATRAWAAIHHAKADALRDLVEELGKPMLVAYEHQHDLQMIREALRAVCGDVPHIGGGVSADRGAALERAWNAGRLRVLALHPQAAAHGLNLQAGGHHLAWYSLPWDLELYDQLNGRLWRQGQRAGAVFIYHLVTRRTIDEWVVKSLQRKAGDQGTLLDALRATEP